MTAPPEFLTIHSNLFHSVAIRNQGDDGVNTYRIPGLATSTNGTVLAVFDIRHNSSGDLPANIDVGLMRSTDGGYTWGPMQTIMDYDETVPGSSGNGVGDPAILVDRVNGRVWCAALWSFGNNGWTGSGTGRAGDDPPGTGLPERRTHDDVRAVVSLRGRPGQRRLPQQPGRRALRPPLLPLVLLGPAGLAGRQLPANPADHDRPATPVPLSNLQFAICSLQFLLRSELEQFQHFAVPLDASVVGGGR